jgi:uncharacterized protein YtpQ (UPF0354 family)
MKLTDAIFFFGTCPSSNFLKKHDIQNSALFLFSGKEGYNVSDPLNWAILNDWKKKKKKIVKISTWEQI